MIAGLILSIEGEVVIRDRGYFGMPARGDDFTMVRRTTDAPLGELDKERNRLISKLRSPGERPHAVIKRVFGAGRVLVTTVRPGSCQNDGNCFCF